MADRDAAPPDLTREEAIELVARAQESRRYGDWSAISLSSEEIDELLRLARIGAKLGRATGCHVCHDTGGDSETGPCPECGGDGGSREYRIALRVARSACPCYGDGETGPTKCGESVAYPTCELHSKIADAFVDFIAEAGSG